MKNSVNDEREDNLRDVLHKQKMVSDNEYFIEWVVENINFNGTLVDIHNELGKWCQHYDNDVMVNDIFEYLKEV